MWKENNRVNKMKILDWNTLKIYIALYHTLNLYCIILKIKFILHYIAFTNYYIVNDTLASKVIKIINMERKIQ